MGNSINKTEVINLKNKSGVNVNRGDIVVLDNLNTSSFFVTGSSQLATKLIGVVMDSGGISNGNNGAIGISGYVPVINLLTGANIGDSIGLSSVAQKGMPHSKLLPGDFGQVLGNGLTPDAILWGNPETRSVFVGARYYAESGAPASATETFCTMFAHKEYDTDNAVQTGSANTIANGWRFTAPVAGYYRITIQVFFDTSVAWPATTLAQTYVYKNGVTLIGVGLYGVNASTSSTNVGCIGTITLFLNQGEYFVPTIYQNSTHNGTLVTAGEYSFIEVVKED